MKNTRLLHVKETSPSSCSIKSVSHVPGHVMAPFLYLSCTSKHHRKRRRNGCSRDRDSAQLIKVAGSDYNNRSAWSLTAGFFLHCSVLCCRHDEESLTVGFNCFIAQRRRPGPVRKKHNVPVYPQAVGDNNLQLHVAQTKPTGLSCSSG